MSAPTSWPPPPDQPPSRQGGGAPARRRDRRTAVVVLAVLLAGSLGVGAYLWLTTVRWQEHSAAWEDEARGYADRVASLDAELAATDAELVAAREQLATATARISDLANEKAQLGDENVASQQYLDYQTRVSEAAGVVTTALGDCVDAQSQLITYLGDRSSYDADDVDRFAADVETLCRQASKANDQLQQELEQ
jgi:septal ring factor EnvC (AmiA/AmiB activator)